jgi:manganese/iron transport system permease protein
VAASVPAGRDNENRSRLGFCPVIAAIPSPLDLVDLPFMRTALAELALLGVAGGLLGTWVVLRRLAFFSHAVGTATFPGLVIADAAGFSAQVTGLAAALLYAGGVERAGRSGRAPGDAATGVLLVAALATGVVLASDVFHSGAAVDRLLFGTLLGLGGGDLVFSVVTAVLALAATLTLGRAWTAIGFDPDTSTSLGLPTGRADLLLLGLVTAAVVAAIPAVGALLVTSVFVVPAACARLLTDSVRGMLACAVAVATAQGALGLYLAYWLDAPPGPAIAALGAGAYALLALGGALR